jgi:hypothetical protein
MEAGGRAESELLGVAGMAFTIAPQTIARKKLLARMAL